MSRPTIPSAALVLALALVPVRPAGAVPGGQIDTLIQGRYDCELPGDALGATGVRQPEADFVVVHGSSYTAAGAKGSYLLTGDLVVMTSGPRRGERYNRISRGFLRKLAANGSESDLRCVLAGRNNSAGAERSEL